MMIEQPFVRRLCDGCDGCALFFNFFQKFWSPHYAITQQRLLRHRTVHVLCRPRWLSKTAGVYLERSVFLSAGLQFQPTHPLIWFHLFRSKSKKEQLSWQQFKRQTDHHQENRFVHDSDGVKYAHCHPPVPIYLCKNQSTVSKYKIYTTYIQLFKQNTPHMHLFFI